jgi:FkbM family methyltransferase
MEDDLLISLRGNRVCAETRILCVVGAHLFEERGLLLELCPKLEKVYLFEPVPQVAQRLRESVASDPRMVVFTYAISDRNGTATFNVSSNDGCSSSLLPFGTHTVEFPGVTMVQEIQVETRTLGDALTGLELPDMLFMDVQGVVYLILSSLSAEVRSKLKIIHTEASMCELYKGGRTLDEIKALLAPEFTFVAFYPLAPHVPMHGNALFVKDNICGA